jgi:hypothetical protein
MAKKPTAAQATRYDQGLAATGADVEMLVGVLKATAAADGGQQAMRTVARL